MTQLRVEVDLSLCIGSGDCVLLAPTAFHLGDADPTVSVLPGAAHTDPEQLRDAEMSCPTGAIRLVSD